MAQRRRKQWKASLYLVELVLVLAASVWFSRERSEGKEVNGTLEVYFLDVGEGDATVITCGNHAMVIDGGKAEDSSYLYSFLREHEILSLDYVIGTHAHADHVGGLAGAMHAADVKEVYCTTTTYPTNSFEAFARTAEEMGSPIVVPEEGFSFSLGEADVTLLSCNSVQDEKENNTCIVIRLVYGKNTFLFMADAEKELEEYLMDRDVEADVLKVGHHGSGTSSSEAFLREVDPSVMVISVGKNNEFGHPHASVLRRLERMNGVLYRTDLQGMIHCMSDGTEVGCTVEKNPDADVMVPGLFE